MRVQRRGKFLTLTTSSGQSVRAELYRCVILREPHVSNGKTYATLDLTHAHGPGLAVLTNVDTIIRKHSAPEFSPLMTPQKLVVKLPDQGVHYETHDGNAGYAFELRQGRSVDVMLKLGSFGSFGYCWIVERIKPRTDLVIN
jgi:hypothetical protein